MKAVCWMRKSKVETLTVADPQLLNPHDAIIKITRTAICSSDLHLYDGFFLPWNRETYWATSSWVLSKRWGKR
ncbi:MAG: Alcohol dehydrogenase GroES domain protein [Edaphobacter sp.]|nr:Alcohol dehydrogenase GroES domain protein [Edaphobacter sp.]